MSFFFFFFFFSFPFLFLYFIITINWYSFPKARFTKAGAIVLAWRFDAKSTPHVTLEHAEANTAGLLVGFANCSFALGRRQEGEGAFGTECK